MPVYKCWVDDQAYFIDKPFQNWTRVGSQIMGSVVVWADYTLPVAEVRREAQRIVEGSKDWDHRFWNLQVTDVTDRAVQLRVLVTAINASKSWDLRCEIREKLLDYMQREYPQSLPQVRAILPSSPSPHNNNQEAEDLVALRQA